MSAGKQTRTTTNPNWISTLRLRVESIVYHLSLYRDIGRYLMHGEELQPQDDPRPNPWYRAIFWWVIIAIAVIGGLFACDEALAIEKGASGKATSTVLCQEREHLVAILEAQQESVEMGVMTFQAYKQFGKCMYVPNGNYIEVTFIDNVGQVDNVWINDTDKRTIYLVAVVFQSTDGTQNTGFILGQTPLEEKGKDA